MKHYKGIIAITPLFVLTLSFLALSAALGDFSKVPLLIVFILTAVYSHCSLCALYHPGTAAEGPPEMLFERSRRARLADDGVDFYVGRSIRIIG